MNNKQLGTAFEREFCELLKQHGFWVHFCTPNASGAQPCDVIAVRDREAYLIDCKTSAKWRFSINRLEDNQKLAFAKWAECGNCNRYIAVKCDDDVFMIPFRALLNRGKVELNRAYSFDRWVNTL